MSGNLVEIHNLSFQHENGHVIFEDIDIQIPRGKVTAILGPSGTGKTTLLRLISGQLAPTNGTISIDGQSVHKLSRNNLYGLRRRMGMLFQKDGLFTHLNVYENVAFPLREHTSLSSSLLRSMVLMKLEMVGLRGAAHLMPNELSGGMARRVALARAISLDPELILYDEPFTGQDPISMGVLLKLVRTLNDALKLTTVIVSHDVDKTLAIADQAYVIIDKHIEGAGTTQAIKDHQSKSLQQFIQGLPDGPVPFHYPARSLTVDFLEEAG